MTNPAHACVPDSVKSHSKPAINEEGRVPDGNTDPYLLTSSSITNPDAFNFYPRLPLIGIVDVKPTLTNEIHVELFLIKLLFCLSCPKQQQKRS